MTPGPAAPAVPLALTPDELSWLVVGRPAE